MNNRQSGKTNYITGYTGYDEVPDSIKTSKTNGATMRATAPRSASYKSGASQKLDEQGMTAAQRYMLEKQRAEAKARAEAEAKRAGVHTGRGNGAQTSRPVSNATPVSAPQIPKLPPITVNLTTVLAVAALVLLIFTFVAYGRIEQDYIPEVERESVMDELMAEMEPELKAGYKKLEVGSENMYSGSLVLVNSGSKYVFNNTPDIVPAEELVVINNVKATKSYKVKDFTVKLNKSTVEKLDKMFDAFYEVSKKGDVMISAGFRSSEDQQRIYDQKVEQLGQDQKIAVLPGESEHHSGYAMDFNIYTDRGITHQFNGDGEYAWIAQNAHKYGFVLRYPDGKTNITGVDYEPWHYRYVGVPHAYYLYTTGKTLEEYITLIKNYPCDYPLYVTDWDGSMYVVYYKKSDGAKTQVPVPENGEYSISGNNVDGYIVTVRESGPSNTAGLYVGNTSAQSQTSTIQIPGQSER